jgi:hypothetical protein
MQGPRSPAATALLSASFLPARRNIKLAAAGSKDVRATGIAGEEMRHGAVEVE